MTTSLITAECTSTAGNVIRTKLGHLFELRHTPHRFATTVVQISQCKSRARVSYLSRDLHAESPRTAFDNVGTVAFWGPDRKKLGDRSDISSERSLLWDLAMEVQPDLQFDTPEPDLRQAVARGYLMLPIYRADDSFQTLPVNGQLPIGAIYVSHGDILHEWGAGAGAVDATMLEKARNYLEGELADLDRWDARDVYGVCQEYFAENVFDKEKRWRTAETAGAPEEYACWGHYGKKYALEELAALVEANDEWLDTDAVAESDGRPSFGL